MDFGSEMGTVMFRFQHAVMEASVSWSPDNGTCDSALSGMNVIVTCSCLTNDVKYTVTIEGSLDISGQQLPFTFSQLLTPMVPPPPPTTSGHD